MQNNLIAGGFLSAAVVSVILVNYWPDDGDEWAAWVQALGSILAIGVAVWVSHDQHQKQVKRDLVREEDEERGILRSLCGEIEASLLLLEKSIGPLLLAQPGPQFNVTYPLGDNHFPVYMGLVSKLGLIRDHQLRMQIIRTYAVANSLVLTFKFNNQLVDEHAAAEERRDAAAINKTWKTLQDYGDGVRRKYAETVSEAQGLITVLHAST